MSRIVAIPRLRIAAIVLTLCSLVTIELFVTKADAAQPEQHSPSFLGSSLFENELVGR